MVCLRKRLAQQQNIQIQCPAPLLEKFHHEASEPTLELKHPLSLSASVGNVDQ